MNRETRRGFVALGVGNTSVQIGYFLPSEEHGLPRPATHLVFPSRNSDWECLTAAIPNAASGAMTWYVASVFRDSAHAIRTWAERRFPDSDFQLLKYADFPLQIDLPAPERVGTDRVASAVAVNRLRADQRSAICIDAGTAITVNAISPQGKFLGGAILPGTAVSGQALAKSTDQLPEIQIGPELLPAAIGRSTEQAIRNGVFWGTIGAVKELVRRFADEPQMSNPQLYVTGGFGRAIAHQLQADRYMPPAIFHPHLVLSGIAIAANERQQSPRESEG